MQKLTERQRRFVDAYIQTGNASESARQAGYSQKGADVTGTKLLVNTSVRAEIDRRLKEVQTARTATLQESLEIMTMILRGEMQEEIALVVGNGKNARLETVKLPPKIKDRLRAAELLAKINGAFRQIEESEIPNEIKIVHAKGSKCDEKI